MNGNENTTLSKRTNPAVRSTLGRVHSVHAEGIKRNTPQAEDWDCYAIIVIRIGR
jgi:hypothetical protein